MVCNTLSYGRRLRTCSPDADFGGTESFGGCGTDGLDADARDLGERGFGGRGFDAGSFDALTPDDLGFDAWNSEGPDCDRRGDGRSLTFRPDRLPVPRRAMLVLRAVGTIADPARRSAQRTARRTGRRTDSH